MQKVVAEENRDAIIVLNHRQTQKAAGPFTGSNRGYSAITAKGWNRRGRRDSMDVRKTVVFAGFSGFAAAQEEGGGETGILAAPSYFSMYLQNSAIS